MDLCTCVCVYIYIKCVYVYLYLPFPKHIYIYHIYFSPCCFLIKKKKNYLRDHSISLHFRILMFSSSRIPLPSSLLTLHWPACSLLGLQMPSPTVSCILPFQGINKHPVAQKQYFMILIFPIQEQGIWKHKGISYISYYYIEYKFNSISIQNQI